MKEGRAGGDIKMFITLVLKGFKYRFLIRWLNNPGDSYFEWWVHLVVEYPNVLTTCSKEKG